MAEPGNRLIHESSPYLRQHAHNPVDWYPWGAEAFEQAKKDNKPILLSVGYSACHWCHVMERESFENPAIARLMNENFVNIKVDREERPDVDHVYMNAVQMLTGRGGWPMTVFLLPDGKPFYGGTYFPPEDRHGMPGFPRVLQSIAQAYRDRPGDIENTVTELMSGLRRLEASSQDAQLPDPNLVVDSAASLARAYDPDNGGLGQAPKFPNTAAFELFLRAWRLTGQDKYLQMVSYTLRRMAFGGIYDQLGGGFHRYSVDAHWLAPHFEKMLYDNAQLVPLYLAAHQATGDELFARIARETLEYVLREMRDPVGGFYSTQDADSEGEEGLFFLWTRDGLERLLGSETAEVVARYWDVTEVGNFEHRNILHVTLEVQQLAKLFRRDEDEVRRMLDGARAKLWAERENRIKPGRDEKILLSWNALMISAFAKAAEVLDDERYSRAAIDAVQFIETHLMRGDRLLSTYKDGVAKLNAYLDDYAFFAAALLDVFEAVQDRRYLNDAVRVTESLLAHFWDADAGGFFFTSDDHEVLIVRSKPSFDGSIPSGNSVALQVLLRLHHYTAEPRYLEKAEAMLRLFGGAARQQPFGFANMLCAIDFYAPGPHEVVLVTEPGDPRGQDLSRRIRHSYLPNRTFTVVSPVDAAGLPEPLTGKGAVDGKPTVYVCRAMTCSPPATTWDEIETLLRA